MDAAFLDCEGRPDPVTPKGGSRPPSAWTCPSRSLAKQRPVVGAVMGPSLLVASRLASIPRSIAVCHGAEYAGACVVDLEVLLRSAYSLGSKVVPGVNSGHLSLSGWLPFTALTLTLRGPSQLLQCECD